MKARIILFLLISLIFQLSTAESNDPKGLMREYARALPEILMANGISKIEDFDLNSFLSEIETIQYEVTNEVIKQGSGLPRYACNYYIKPRHLVICNQFENSTAVLPLVLLHESLGALGYYDENYEMSTIISTFALTKKFYTLPSLLEPFKNIKRRTDNSLYLAIGGGTSVGGGGDSVGITIKSFCIATLLNILNNNQLSKNQSDQILNSIEKIMSLSIENSENKSIQTITFEYSKSTKRANVPYHLWKLLQQNYQNLSQNMTLLTELFEPIFDYAMSNQ